MSNKSPKKVWVKQLQKLLRALSREGALLASHQGEAHSGPRYQVMIPGESGMEAVGEPDTKVANYVLEQDLLIQEKNGWVLGPNGRLALKRILSGAEPFAEQHQSRRITRSHIAGEECVVLVNDRSSTLGWLSRRKDPTGAPMISKIQFAAGERLAQDFLFAGLMPRITSSWSGPSTGGQRRCAPGAGIEMSDNRLAARQRVRAAIEEVGSDLSDALLDICCFQLGLSEAEKVRGWPRRSGKLILQFALDRLALHYGMTRVKSSIVNNSSISHWGAEGYKPM